MHTVFVYKIGPTSVGKGYSVDLCRKSYKGLVTDSGLMLQDISFGQIIRDKMKNDRAFQKKYLPTIGKGSLLDDPTAIEIFSEALDQHRKEGDPDIIIVDGFCRTTIQVDFAIQNGFLRKQDIVFIIEASIEVCLERFLKRLKKEPGRVDSEIETFRKRYHLHRDTIGDIRSTLEEATDRSQIFDIDATEDIAKVAHPAINSKLLPVAFRQIALRDKARLVGALAE